jgi:hypothetical protein
MVVAAAGGDERRPFLQFVTLGIDAMVPEERLQVLAENIGAEERLVVDRHGAASVRPGGKSRILALRRASDDKAVTLVLPDRVTAELREFRQGAEEVLVP